jgi:LPXTG-motif cell wall-anchored protein
MAWLVGAAIATALAIGTALLFPADGSDPERHFRWIAPVSVAVLGMLVGLAGVWSATAVYALVFWCFHFGLVALIGSGYVEVEDLPVWNLSWLTGPHAADAAILSLAGLLAFAAGAALVFSRRKRDVPADTLAPALQAAHAHGAAGSMLVLATIAAWCFIVVATGGPTGFFVSYEDYRTMTAEFGDLLGVVWLLMGCGLVLSVTGAPGGLRTAASAAFAAFAIVALPIGLRSEVMFRGTAALVGAARCGRAFSTRKAIAIGVLLLVLIPVVREVRNTGLGGLPDAVLAPRISEAFAEMGGSLNPVEKVVRWHAEGEPYERGRSYWAPIERAAARLLPGIDATAAENDLRITSVLVTDRVGAIGFSPVAEAFRNFGPLGVVIVLALFGALMAAIDAIRDRRLAVLTLAVVYVPLLMNVRNSFVYVPAHCAAGLALMVALGIARHVLGSVIGRPYARPAYIRSEV